MSVKSTTGQVVPTAASVEAGGSSISSNGNAWIAMMLAQNAQCLLLDEPTSALDLLHQDSVLALLRELSHERRLTRVAARRRTCLRLGCLQNAVIRLQVLLDRLGSSPGVIDGHYGENVTKAIAGLEAMRGIPTDGKLDPEVIRLLLDDQPVIGAYVISPEDTQDLVDRIPKDYARQARMRYLGYTSVAEKLSERFHMDIDLLKALNAGTPFTVGKTILVAMPGNAKEDMVKRIEVRRRIGQVLAFGKDGSLLAVYPATIGSRQTPSPSGTHKVKGVARMPPYSYDPKINFQQGKNKRPLTLPKGPNGPVGTIWIDLTEPTYGIHGTPEPSLIDKIGSHGCVRLTNWDAEELAAMVKPGVTVEFVD